VDNHGWAAGVIG